MEICVLWLFLWNERCCVTTLHVEYCSGRRRRVRMHSKACGHTNNFALILLHCSRWASQVDSFSVFPQSYVHVYYYGKRILDKMLRHKASVYPLPVFPSGLSLAQ